MEFDQVVTRRRMTRNFADLPISADQLERIVDNARRGPSAGFTQGQDFVAVTDLEVKRAIAELCGEQGYVEMGFSPFISQAPVLIIPCTSEAAYHRRYQELDKIQDDGTEIEWPVPFWYMDGGCAEMLVLLSAVNEGLAAGFVGVWELDRLRALLGIPAEVTPLGVIPIGHPAPDKPSPTLKRGHRPIDQVVHREQW